MYTIKVIASLIFNTMSLGIQQISSLEMAVVLSNSSPPSLSLFGSNFGPIPSGDCSLLDIKYRWPLSLPTFFCLLYPC
jgi:hypothetical protein